MEDGPMPSFLPGMFVSVSIPLASETRVRPYTIASRPDAGEPFELVFNRVPNGPGAAWMFERKPRDVLEFTGPFGAFTLERPLEMETVFIAEGTAIAPIRPMLHRALADGSAFPVRLLYGAQDQLHVLYADEIKDLVRRHPRFSFEIMIAEPQLLSAQLGDEVERRWVLSDTLRDRRFFICGVGPGVMRIRDLLRNGGYERRSVRYERW
jgi:ferredoxin-NADP reductase